MNTDQAPLARPEGRMLAAVTNAIVSVYKDQLGRGPTRARSDWAGADGLVVVLEETMTTAEHRLCDLGHEEQLRGARLLYRQATLPALVEPVERLTGRTVRAFVSGIDTGEDVSTEHFLFHPQGEERLRAVSDHRP